MTIGCRDFETSSSEYGEVASAIVSSYPFTFACWVKPESVGTAQVIFSIATSGSANNYYRVDISSSGANRTRARDGSGVVDAITSSTMSAGNWYFVAGVFASATDRRAFVGTNKATNTSSRTATGVNRTSIGRSADSSGTATFDGKIALPCVWNVALSDSDISTLAGGAYPTTVQGGSILSFWPFDGSNPEPDSVGSNNLAMTGTVYTTADYPPVTEPSTTYNETLTEGLTAGDSLSSSATFPNALSEGPTAGDSFSSTAAFSSPLTEGPTAGDSLSSTAAVSSTLEEPLTAGESLEALAAFSYSLTEGLTAGDSYGSSVDGAPQVYEEELSEGLTAGDSLSSTASVASSLSEGLTASDSLGAFLAVPVGLSEGLTTVDSVDSLAVFSSELAETLTVDDSLDSTAEYSEELQESLEAGDSCSASMGSDPTGFGLVWEALPSRAHWTSRGKRPQWEVPPSRLHWTVPG